MAFQQLKKQCFDFVICDYQLPEMNGLEVLTTIKHNFPQIEVIITSESVDTNTVAEAFRSGAIDYVPKPFSSADICFSIEKLRSISELKMKYQSEMNKNLKLRKLVDTACDIDLIGSSRVISEIKNQIRIVAQTPNTSVLILGECGTEKQIVARAIHNLSTRKGELFLPVHTSAISEKMFESDCCGHKKGSFVGACTDKAGWFETANKGTLFFDDIGAMSPTMQTKLVRVLHDKCYTKVGTHTTSCFDTRMIAATSKPIDFIAQGNELLVE